MKTKIAMTIGDTTYVSANEWESIEEMTDYLFDSPDMMEAEFPTYTDSDSGERAIYALAE
jgi:hypothetical protein